MISYFRFIKDAFVSAIANYEFIVNFYTVEHLSNSKYYRIKILVIIIIR